MTLDTLCCPVCNKPFEVGDDDFCSCGGFLHHALRNTEWRRFFVVFKSGQEYEVDGYLVGFRKPLEVNAFSSVDACCVAVNLFGRGWDYCVEVCDYLGGDEAGMIIDFNDIENLDVKPNKE